MKLPASMTTKQVMKVRQVKLDKQAEVCIASIRFGDLVMVVKVTTKPNQ
jgi:hypothetical protein